MKTRAISLLWEVENDLLSLMQTKKPLLCSIWWSGAMHLRAKGYDVSMLLLRMAIGVGLVGWRYHRLFSDWKLDAAYDYLNWWLTGPAGAYLCRQGGYFINLRCGERHIFKHMNMSFGLKVSLRDMIFLIMMASCFIGKAAFVKVAVFMTG